MDRRDDYINKVPKKGAQLMKNLNYHNKNKNTGSNAVVKYCEHIQNELFVPDAADFSQIG